MKILIAMQSVQANDILKDMTREALGSIKSEHDWGVYVDNRDISLASKWNYALEMGLDYDYTFLINNDIVLYEDTLDRIVSYMEHHKEYMFVSSNQLFEGEVMREFGGEEIDDKLHWSFVCCRADEVIKKLGYVDTIFERGSFVDTEWEIRARKMGFKMCRLLASRFLHYNDSTHRFLPQYRNVFESNDRKLQEKWGMGMYDHPYNNPNLSMSFIGEYNEK